MTQFICAPPLRGRGGGRQNDAGIRAKAEGRLLFEGKLFFGHLEVMLNLRGQNNLSDLVGVFEQLPFQAGKPSLVLAHTTKGKGISFIENAVDWHHHVPSDAEYEIAMTELAQAERHWQEKYARA